MYQRSTLRYTLIACILFIQTAASPWPRDDLVARTRSACGGPNHNKGHLLDDHLVARLNAACTPESSTHKAFSAAAAAIALSKFPKDPGYDYQFVEILADGKLGMQLLAPSHSTGGHLGIGTVDPQGLAGLTKSIQFGDHLVAINSVMLHGLSLNECFEVLSSAESPRTMLVRRKEVKKLKAAARPIAAASSQTVTATGTTSASFTITVHRSGPLGLVLLADLTVKELVAGGSAIMAGNVRAGDSLVSVNGKSVIHPKLLDLNEVVGLIAKATSPRILSFTSGDKTPRKSVQVGQPPTDTAALPSTSTNTGAVKPENIGPVAIQLKIPAILEGESYSAVRAEFDQGGGACTQPIALTAGIPQTRKLMTMGCTAPPLDVNVTGAVLLVKRGMCSFVTKARVAHKAGAAGIIVVNDDSKPLVAMPAAQHELPHVPEGIIAYMVSKEEGEAMQGIANSGLVLAKFGPAGKCTKSNDINEVSEWMIKDRAWEMEIKNGKEIKRRVVQNTVSLSLWAAGGLGMPPFEQEVMGLYALFGPRPEVNTRPMGVVMAEEGMDACNPFQSTDIAYGGAMIVVFRGGCSFTHKAMVIQRAGGAGMLVVNTDPGMKGLFEMPGEDAETEAMVKITSMMISPETWKQIKSVLQPHNTDGKATISNHVIARLYTRQMYWCDLRAKKVCGWE